MHRNLFLRTVGVALLLVVGPMALAAEVRVLSYNTWLLDFIASDIEPRRATIPAEVERLKPDIVSLQEVWGSRHKHALIREFRKLGYPYAIYASEKGTHVVGPTDPFPDIRSPVAVASLIPSFLSSQSILGLFGWRPEDMPESVLDIGEWTNGLLGVSRYPISSSFSRRMDFSVDTQVEERLVEKGALLAAVHHPSGATLLVVNTHLGAQDYDMSLGRYYPPHHRNNLIQLKELAQWTRDQATDYERHFGGLFNVVVNGDLNFNYRQVVNQRWTLLPHAAYQELTLQKGGLRMEDVFPRGNGEPSIEAFTCGPVNPYSRQQADANRPSEVLDYIFVGQKEGWSVLDAKVVLTAPPSQELMAASDHFGVLAEIQIDR